MSYMPSLDAQMNVRGRSLFSQIYAWMAAGLLITGAVVFVGLAAADTQRIKRMALQVSDQTSAGRVAILGALQLYLDFVNLFLLLLRITGGRRD
jgi:uncharacterized protein